ncbi:hypothetical protein THRCLA_23002 [Thraustotheca clavata]|uniref:Uncharacterized protein n=1 Tax=Thraustotheca clavata TaxID=74557 RepID=A0A1V9YJH0_9STRA|nr:hypothetical protein THRCLA_23002 [Thraustotheca clavata]
MSDDLDEEGCVGRGCQVIGCPTHARSGGYCWRHRQHLKVKTIDAVSDDVNTNEGNRSPIAVEDFVLPHRLPLASHIDLDDLDMLIINTLLAA